MKVVRTLPAFLSSAVALTVGDKLLLLGTLLLVLVFVFVLLGSPTRSTHLIAIINALRGRAELGPEPVDDSASRRRLSRRHRAGDRG